MPEDRIQVGLTEEADAQSKILRDDTPYFAEEADVYRVGVAIALALGAAVTDRFMSDATIRTKYRTVKSDSTLEDDLPRLDTADRKLAKMVELFYPEASGQPYRYSQYLASIGINHLHEELISNSRTLRQVIDALSAGD